MPELPEFEGEVIQHGDADYMAQCYQYASSSYLKEGIIQPAVIIMAKNDSDVIKAINYARDRGIAVAVRTGGHQYSGASSTDGDNIQLDLSKTYKNFHWDNGDHTSVTLGVSHSVGELNEKLKEKNRFVPHGQCQSVTMGGHIQTGGYGLLARSFGLLSDYVKQFRIITANGEVQWVDKSNNSALFFAVLGGSPGNFGVITDVTLNVLRDQDYPNSRGFRAVYYYTRQRLKYLLDVMVKMAEDDEFPADYDYCITALEESEYTTNKINYDMLYDRGPPQLIWPHMIVVFAQWANLEGEHQTYNSSFIDKIRQVADDGHIEVSDESHIPMSTLTSHWIFPITREFKFPYIKRTYSSNSSSERLENLGWTDWVSNQIDVGYHSDNFKLSAQFFHLGGSNSRFYQNGEDNSTSFSWRDTRLCCTVDAFYYNYLYMDPYKDEEAWTIRMKHKQVEAKMWQSKNDEGVGNPDATFCEDDRRLLWGSHDLDLSANQQYYYDKHPEGKYELLCQIKRNYDSSGVFTPNKFCIIPPENIQFRINLTDLETAKEEVAVMELQEKSQLNAKDKFLKMVKMKREVGKPVPLWDIWHV